MNIEYNNIFPTMIMVVRNVLTNKECHDIFEYLKNISKNKISDNSFDGYGIGEGETSFDLTFDIVSEISENVSGMKDLKKRLQKYVNDYNDKFGLKELEITNSWTVFQKKDSILSFHIHPESILSGTIYVNIDDDSSGLSFYNPNNFIYYMQKNKSTELNYTTFTIKPEKGMMILFPSYINHGSLVKNKTNDRCIIGFNSYYGDKI